MHFVDPFVNVPMATEPVFIIQPALNFVEIRVSPHTCRHTFAHLNLKNGIDLYTLSRLLGHESVSITQRYLEGITDEGVIRIARKTGVLENISRL